MHTHIHTYIDVCMHVLCVHVEVSITVTNTREINPYKEERFILAHSFKGFTSHYLWNCVKTVQNARTQLFTSWQSGGTQTSPVMKLLPTSPTS
jgi:hypothetical protein